MRNRVFTRGDRRRDRRRDNRRNQLPVVNTRGDSRRHDRRNRTGDRSSNQCADRRRYANFMNQKYA